MNAGDLVKIAVTSAVTFETFGTWTVRRVNFGENPVGLYVSPSFLDDHFAIVIIFDKKYVVPANRVQLA